MISIKCFINSFELAVISLSCSNFSMKPSFTAASLRNLANVSSFCPIL